MRVLVTGGAGFIGSTLVDRLVERGDEVVVVDSLGGGRRENLAGALASGRVRLIEADAADPEIDALVKAERPEVVHHLAAQIDVRHSVADPLHDALVNILGTIRVAQAAAAAGARRLVFAASGGTAYGEPDPDRLPVAEDAPANPTAPYGVSKRSAEDYLRTFNALYGLETVSLRLANVYGPRQDPHGEAGVVAIFCNRLLAGEPVTIFGDGTQTRDYVYVGDVVDAFVLAAERPEAAGGGFNIGTGIETSVLDLYATLRSVAGTGAEPGFAPPRQGELGRVALDAGLAGRVLGWTPRTPLAEGLRRALAWARAADQRDSAFPDAIG
jgi:UDP-glucose 4-epimerase